MRSVLLCLLTSARLWIVSGVSFPSLMLAGCTCGCSLFILLTLTRSGCIALCMLALARFGEFVLEGFSSKLDAI